MEELSISFWTVTCKYREYIVVLLVVSVYFDTRHKQNGPANGERLFVVFRLKIR